MVCQEDKTGAISCHAPEKVVTFTVEEINDGNLIIDEFMDMSCKRQPVLDYCPLSLEQAILDYDKFIFASMVLGHTTEKVQMQSVQNLSEKVTSFLEGLEGAERRMYLNRW